MGSRGGSWRADELLVTTSGGRVPSSAALVGLMTQAGDASALAWKRPGLVLK